MFSFGTFSCLCSGGGVVVTWLTKNQKKTSRCIWSERVAVGEIILKYSKMNIKRKKIYIDTGNNRKTVTTWTEQHLIDILRCSLHTLRWLRPSMTFPLPSTTFLKLLRTTLVTPPLITSPPDLGISIFLLVYFPTPLRYFHSTHL